MKLVTDRSRNISRLEALLDRLGINSNGDFTTYKRLKAIPEMQEKYETLKQRKGHNTAKVALAREMLKIIYHILVLRKLPGKFIEMDYFIMSIEKCTSRQSKSVPPDIKKYVRY